MALSPISRLTVLLARPTFFLVTVLVALTLLGFNAHQAQATIYYVSTTGTGNGSSWATAGPLQATIAAAKSGDQVWVKYGTYTGNCTATDGVTVYGHFAGRETGITQRQLTNMAYTTTLDGNKSGTVHTILGAATGTDTLDFIIDGSADATTTNLLTNPGAETGDLTGWTVGGDSNPGVDNGTFDPGINPHSGQFDFYGHTGSLGTLTQNVSLVDNQGITAQEIDAGELVANLSFWEQGLNQSTTSDDAQIELTFLDANQSTISTYTTPELDSHDGTWQQGTGSVAVPALTRSINYTMVFIRHYGSDLDAFVDDNILTISYNPPTITSFSPTSGPVGTTVTITGTNFTGATLINFHDASTTSFTVNGAGTQITVNVPRGALTGTIKVTTPGGAVTSNQQFTITSAPTITSLSPTSGTVGTAVTITGTNFTGATLINFHDASTTVFTVNGAGTQITVNVPTGALTGTIKVTTPAGASTSSQQFTVTVAAPTITSFSPASGPAGTAVTITGTNFTGATAVKFNGTAAASFTVVSATSITATVPYGATTGAITVTTSGGTAPSATNFTVTLPTVKSLAFSPATIAPGGTSMGTVTLNGDAPSGGAVVTITFDSFTFTTVTIAAGQTTGTFTAMASGSAPAGGYAFTAAYDNSSASATLTVN